MADGSFSLATFPASELAISMALVAFFVEISIFRREVQLDNEDKQFEAGSWAFFYQLIALIFTVLFAIIVYSGARDGTPDIGFQIAVFVLTPIIIFLTRRVQQTFDLRVAIR